MFYYKVIIRESINGLSEQDKLIQGNTYCFIPSGYISGGHAHGEVKMVPHDENYPEGAPECLALGDLELIFVTERSDYMRMVARHMGNMLKKFYNNQ